MSIKNSKSILTAALVLSMPIYSYASVIENTNTDFNYNYTGTTSKTENLNGLFNGENSNTIDTINDTYKNNTINLNSSANSLDSSQKYETIVNGVFISNSGTILPDENNNSIITDFINNTVNIDYENTTAAYSRVIMSLNGGMIYNNGLLQNISGNFIKNNIITNNYSNLNSYGGVLYNGEEGIINVISGNFSNNSLVPSGNNMDYSYKNVQGGAIANEGRIYEISADFTNNHSSYNAGALYNSGQIELISGNFTDNNATQNGGAVYNSNHGEIHSVTGDFTGNSVTNDTKKGEFAGGAIYSQGTISIIDGNFKNNKVDIHSSSGDRYDWIRSAGGAVYGYADTISGNFENNEANAISEGDTLAYGGTDAFGGALMGGAKLVNATFINNTAYAYSEKSNSAGAHGGAISSTDVFEDFDSYNIVSIFKNNTAKAIAIEDSAYTYGGAIYAENVNELNSVFENNIAYSKSQDNGAKGSGGAVSIENINKLNSDFKDNNITIISTSSEENKWVPNEGYGGAVSSIEIKEINGTFINNGITADTTLSNNASGGAVYSKNIGSINANFESNYIKSSNINNTITASGGALSIENERLYGDPALNDTKITANFKNNTIEASSENGDVITRGGAINLNNNGVKLDLSGNFEDNKITASSNNAKVDASGGALSIKGLSIPVYDNWGNLTEIEYTPNKNIAEIKGDFINNSVTVTSSNGASTAGGAIYSEGNINEINGNFINNKILLLNSRSDNNTAQGGAIYNGENTRINKIKGNFKNNSIDIDKGQSEGGAIYIKEAEITESYDGYHSTYYSFSTQEASGANIIDSVYNENFVKTGKGTAKGGAVYVNDKQTIDNKIDIFTSNILSDWDSNKNLEYLGVYYYNKPSEKMTIENSVFSNNSAISKNGNALGGAVYLGSKYTVKNVMEIVYADESPEMFVKDFYDQIMNAIDNGTLTNNFIEYDKTTEIINSTFINNTAEANGTDVEAHGGAIYTKQDIYIKADNGQTVFSGNKTITNGAVDTEGIYVDNNLDETDPEFAPVTLTFDTTNKGLIHLDDKVNGSKPYNIELTGDDTGRTVFNNTVNNASIRTNDGSNTYLTNENNWNNNIVTLNGGSLSMVNNGIGVSHLNTLAVTNDTKVSVDVDLAGKSMDRFTADNYGTHSGNVVVAGMNLLSDSIGDNTYIDFAEEGLRNNVSTQINELNKSTQLTEAYTPIYKYGVEYMNNSGQFLFSRGDKNSSDSYNPSILVTPVASQAGGQATITESFKYVFQHADSFTQLPSMERFAQLNANKYALNSDFSGVYSPLTNIMHNSGVWVRPYTALETINLKNGPKVDTTTYGTMVGFDSNFKEMKNGWHNVFTGYLGYTGATLNYNGVDTSMNGGMLGLTETFYKGNFFTAITASAGASVGQSHTMYGSEDFTSLLAGIGSKTGYNFEFNNGKFIIQPVMFLSYTFVNTFDYTNASGNRIESDPLHSIQINPSVKFIGNLKGGWQPYASVGMVWNVMDETKVTADNIKLPEMSMKPYVEYGLGVQRNWAEKYTAFLQTMIRNGGRNGISFTGGFRMMLGDPKGRNLHELKQQTL